MSYIKNTLLPNERVLYYIGPHAMVFYPCFLWIVVVIGILLFLPRYTILVYISLAMTVLYAISAYIIYASSEYGITDKRVLMKVGFIRRNSLEIFFHKIESINVDQTILGRIFDYGTIVICGTGGSKDPFFFIPRPLEFRRRVQEQMEHFMHNSRPQSPSISPHSPPGAASPSAASTTIAVGDQEGSVPPLFSSGQRL